MKNIKNIRFKFTVGLAAILISLGLVLNMLIISILNKNMETSVNNSLKEVMKSSREYIKYRLAADSLQANTDGLKEEGKYIVKYISVNYGCDIRVSDMKGELIANEGNNEFENIIKEQMNDSKDGKAVVNFKYVDKGMHGILSYPIYLEGRYLGILTISKNYDQVYLSYNYTIKIITAIEISVFFCIFILAFIITTKITKPITKLTEAVKQVGEGEYDVKIKIKSKDEVGILSQEFINMKNKIKEQIQTINHEKDKVEKLEQVRKQFFDNVTHELRTPLTAISGYAEMIRDEIVVDEEFNKRAIERIYSESERLHYLVLELINVSKGSSLANAEKQLIYMENILNDICDDMSIKAKKYSLYIDRKIQKGTILGQANRIKELIINIIDNAIKYSNNGEKIQVISHKKENFYVLEISNKAEPIPEGVYNHIFQPFIKSESSKEKGSRGLGLYICSEIIKEHDGDILIENGEKITVKIKIPCFGNNLETN